MEFALKFQSTQWNATIVGNFSVKAASQSGRRTAHSNALDSFESVQALISSRSSSRSSRFLVTIAKSWSYFRTSKNTRSGARKISVQTSNVKWSLSTEAAKNSSTRRRQSRYVTMFATKCSDSSRQWKMVIRMRYYCSLSSILLTRRRVREQLRGSRLSLRDLRKGSRMILDKS